MFLRGVDSRRDTAEQIEKGIRIFPQFLEDRYQINDGEDLPLLVFLVQNLQSVSFIPTILNLAKEFDHVVSGYSEGNRWGLLDAWEDDDIPQFSYSDLNVLKYLVLIAQLSDRRALSVIRQLRAMGLFHASDVVDYYLLHHVCNQTFYISKCRFLYLVRLNPMALATKDWFQMLPLHHVAPNWLSCSYRKFRDFLIVFHEGMRYFALQFGFLFHVDNEDSTPYRQASQYFDEADADAMINPYLAPFDSLRQLKLLISLASNPDVHLDGIFIVMRRNPSFAADAIAAFKRKNDSTKTSKRKLRGGRTIVSRSKAKRRSTRLQQMDNDLTRSGNQF
eukprot:jgi/Psemu1/179496/e_gw1.9.77.1